MADKNGVTRDTLTGLSEVILKSLLDFIPSKDIIVCTTVCRSLNDLTSNEGLVKRVNLWWEGMETWLQRELPSMYRSLSKGVSESQLDNAEKRLGMSLPTELRLLYRLHNGQVTTTLYSISIGLFGGYCLYHHRVSSVMSSLNGGVKGALVAQMSKGIPGEYVEDGGGGTSTTNMNKRVFLLAVSHNRAKQIWVDENGNVKISGTPRMSGGLTFDGAPLSHGHSSWSHGHSSWSHGHSSWSPEGAPGGAEPPPDQTASSGSEAKTNRQGDGSRSGSGGNLLAWLEEYRRRVEGGWYHTQKLRFSSDPRPVRPIGGVEVQVSPVFVAELCTINEFVWGYSVRMCLLRDHPSRPKLFRRHWEMDGGEGFHREVDGEAVVGHYPTLSLTEDSQSGETRPFDGHLFEYQSCTGLRRPPGTMGGYFTFTQGTLSTPTGPEFRVRVPTFELTVPEFIY